MPNWCEGSLKVRGGASNVKKFIEEGLQPVTYGGEPKEKLEVKLLDPEYGYYECHSGECCYIKHTRRGFVDGLGVEFEADDNEDVVVVLDAQFAWSIDAEGLRKVSEEFGVDLRMYGFETGMGFNQEVEVIAGEITMNEEYIFSDYRWECPCPNMGG